GGGERDGGEEALQPLLVGRDFRINFTVGSLEVGIRDQAGPAVPRARDVDHVEVVLVNNSVEVNVDEVQAWRRPPVAEEPWLDVILCERLLEQRVVVEIDLADGKVIGRP